MKYSNLFIDELGSASPRSRVSQYYILSAVQINKNCRDQIKINADQIKYKYWSKTNIIFHSRDIGRAEGEFKILKDVTIKNNFEKDLFKFLTNLPIQIFSVIADKKHIPKNWNEKTIYKKTADLIICNFILSLLAQKNIKGRLIIESATAEKDFYYHRSAGFYLSRGFPEQNISYTEVQDVLTEISFVTKKNNDIEEQIADLFAYGLKIKYELNKKYIKFNQLTEYEKKIIKIVEAKLFKINPSTGNKKKKFYSRINSFEILP